MGELSLGFLLLKKRKMEKSNMANNAPYPTVSQTNLDSASAPPSYEQSQFQGNPASPNHMKSPFNPNVDGAGDLRQRQVRNKCPISRVFLKRYIFFEFLGSSATTGCSSICPTTSIWTSTNASSMSSLSINSFNAD